MMKRNNRFSLLGTTLLLSLIACADSEVLSSVTNETLVYDCALDQTEISPEECQGLVDLYNSTNGDNWLNNTNWGSPMPSNWFGVSVTNGIVRSVSLANNGLQGNLPVSIGNLHNVSGLNLSENSLIGNIPKEIGGMTRLSAMILHTNQITGPIPTQIGSLSNLSQLNLLNNQLTGSIPRELGNINNLRVLALNSNQLIGSIPSSLGEIGDALNILQLKNNLLSGAVPENFDEDFTSMLALGLSGNQCLHANGDTSLASWIRIYDREWQDGCGPCGNGVVEEDEVCDDGNKSSGDGCSATCQLEEGYVCFQDSMPQDGICDTGGEGSVIDPQGGGIVIGGGN